MSREVFFLVFYLQTFLSALIALISFYRYRERSFPVRLIGILFVASFLCNLAGYLGVAVFKLQAAANIPGSIYDGILVVMGAILYNHLTQGKYRGMFMFMTVLFLIPAVLNVFFLQQSSVATYNKLAASFVMIFYSIFYFYRLMIELPTIHLQRLPMFWFNSAFLIFHAGAVCLFAVATYLISTNDFDLGYWVFHNSLTIVQQAIFLVGMVYDLRNRSSTSNI